MARRWWELRLSAAAEDAEDLAGLLVAHGALGVELVPLGPTEVELRVSYDGALAPAEVEAAAAAGLAELGLEPHAVTTALSERADEAWATAWKEHFRPLQLGRRVWIVPSWEQAFTPPAQACVLTLDPGMAFGTGQHETTALCLEWLERELATHAGARLLDVGCGSGILAIAGAKLGAGGVVAIDNDPDAVTVCRENTRLNGVTVATSTTPLAELPDPAELVVANILAETLITLAAELVRHTAPGGRLAVSGVLVEQADAVAAALLAAGGETWRRLEQQRRGSWVLLAFGR